MIKFLEECRVYCKNFFFVHFNEFLNKIYFYRYPVFHNYLALLYFITGLHTVLYFCKITPAQFVIQLGLLVPISGRFWYDVLPEFLNDSPSKRLSCETLEDIIFVLDFGIIDYFNDILLYNFLTFLT